MSAGTHGGVPSPAALFDLTGKVAIVTGASSGLGERFARVLDSAGASVVLVARRAERLEKLAAELRDALPVVADVSVPEQLEAVVPAALQRHGRLDVLVNNAGLGEPAPAVDEDLDRFRYVLDVNLVGLFHLARLAAEPMLEAGSGSIINIASIFGLRSSWPIPNAAYTSSKGAVVQLSRDLGCQWAARGVRVNALCPGMFPAESTVEMQTPEAERYIRRKCPMGRLGEAHELDGALLFLAGAASSFMTGQTLVVDGGWTAH
jgi:NAD(P)-dependent dehydrogenase (short-subunit alcohol dehydrogenase family)